MEERKMKNSQIMQLAVIAALSLGLQACSKDKKKSPAPGLVTPQEKADQCPVGVESLWFVQDGHDTAFAVSKVDGQMRMTLGGYEEQILINGQTQKLTPKEKGIGDNTLEVTAKCENQVILMSEKDAAGTVKHSEWRLNSEEGLGLLTIKKDGEIEEQFVLRMNIVPDAGK